MQEGKINGRIRTGIGIVRIDGVGAGSQENSKNCRIVKRCNFDTRFQMCEILMRLDTNLLHCVSDSSSYCQVVAIMKEIEQLVSVVEPFEAIQTRLLKLASDMSACLQVAALMKEIRQLKQRMFMPSSRHAVSPSVPMSFL